MDDRWLEPWLTLYEVLFGLPTYNNPDLKLTNFLILIGKHGKWLLNNVKSQNRPMYLQTLLP